MEFSLKFYNLCRTPAILDYVEDLLGPNFFQWGGQFFLKEPKDIAKKIQSYSHSEFNTTEFTNEKKIAERIKNRQDIFDRNYKYEKVDLNNTFPKYILENLKKFENWIIK